MEAITEDHIYNFIDRLDKDEKLFFQIRDKLIDTQVGIAGVLTDESLDILKEDEYDLLWFMLVVIFGSTETVISSIKAIDAKAFEKMEESNWSIWNNQKTSDWRSRLDPFFDNYPQEDLLAFVEDSLEEDEELLLSLEGREIIFILCKTLIDALHHSNK